MSVFFAASGTTQRVHPRLANELSAITDIGIVDG
jgi:hypothetical protein